MTGRAQTQLPDSYPAWAHEFGELYFSGTTNTFLLHGNTQDVVPAERTVTVTDGPMTRTEKRPGFVPLDQFLTGHLFGTWDLVLYYDLATGLRVAGGSDPERQRKMTELAARKIGDLKSIGKDPTAVLHVLDRFVHKNVMAQPGDRVSLAVVLGHASFLARRGDRGLKASTHVVTLLNWASSPYVKRLNTAFVLTDSTLSDMSERLVGSPHVASLDIDLPDEDDRRAYLDHLVGDRDVSEFSDFDTGALADLTAGISLTDLRVLVGGTMDTGRRLDAARFSELKKTLIERQAGGLLEFVEPKWRLDMVVGHAAAKQRLQDDAELLRKGRADIMPMGYLLCGPVGTGKSFLAECAARTLGIPCVKLKNFRGGLVGETEGNLERVIGVLRGMGPVAVVVDEADAMLGQRKSGGDSGTSSRVFGMIAQQMGDTRYRGRIVWILMTTRPDYLPIDLKRQGRAEIHIPLFYPTQQNELHRMFLVLAKKLGATLMLEDVPLVPEAKLGQISGADVEGIVGRAWRKSLLRGHDHIERAVLEEALDNFIPMAQSLERELQKLAAIVECTDEEFMPQEMRLLVDEMGGLAKVQERLNTLKAVVDGQ